MSMIKRSPILATVGKTNYVVLFEFLGYNCRKLQASLRGRVRIAFTSVYTSLLPRESKRVFYNDLLN